MANSADPDQLASSEANWSGSTLFAKAGYMGFSRIRVNEYLHFFHGEIRKLDLYTAKKTCNVILLEWYHKTNWFVYPKVSLLF